MKDPEKVISRTIELMHKQFLTHCYRRASLKNLLASFSFASQALIKK